MPPPPAPWGVWLTQTMQRLRQHDLLRVLRPVLPAEGTSASPVRVRVAASTRDAWLGDSTAPTAAPGPGDRLHELTLFSTNDYLGLSTHAGVKEAVCAAVARHGMGPRASSLVAGHTQAQRDLELQLAALKGHEDAVLLPCGFSANLAVAAVLAADDEVDVFSDALNHASIIDGLRLATRRSTHGRGQGVRVFVYQHSDMAHLQELLSASTAARKLVITDTLFSMDGDFAPMQALLALRQQHGFLLAVDDAHATLVCERSRRTRGVAAEAAAEVAALCKQADVVVGTMSKALGSQGGFVCCSREMRSALINLGRPLIYSTALPVPIVAASAAAISACQVDASIRERLWERVAQFERLTGLAASSPIIPVVLGPEAAALDASRKLLLSGMHVPAIRPPTVEPGTARLRVALSAAHSEEDVVQLARALKDTGVLALALSNKCHSMADASPGACSARQQQVRYDVKC